MHNLDAKQRLLFMLNGTPLPRSIAISESPLASTQNLQVHIKVLDFPVMRGRDFGATASGIPASQVRQDPGRSAAERRGQTVAVNSWQNAAQAQSASTENAVRHVSLPSEDSSMPSVPKPKPFTYNS